MGPWCGVGPAGYTGGGSVLPSLRLYPPGHGARLGTFFIGKEELGRGLRCLPVPCRAQGSPRLTGPWSPWSVLRPGSPDPGRGCPDVESPGLGGHQGRLPDSPRLGTGHSALTPRLWALDLPSSSTTWTPPSLRSSGTYGHLLCARLGERSAHWVPVRKRGILYSWAVGCGPPEGRSFHLRDTLGLCSRALMQDPGQSCSDESAAGPSMWLLGWGSWPEAPWTGVSASVLSRK